MTQKLMTLLPNKTLPLRSVNPAKARAGPFRLQSQVWCNSDLMENLQ